MVASEPSILFIDAYDSFTNNIISLLTTALSCSVRVIHIDSPEFETDEALFNELRHYDAVVCGPGPGNPAVEKDVGLMNQIWRLNDENLLPVLGICLGFQSLCLAFGGQVQVLNEGLHGRVRKVNHIGQRYQGDLFDSVGVLRATLYHSLYVGSNWTASDGLWEAKRWESIDDTGDLHPLAWADDETIGKGKWKDEHVLMAVRHRYKPFWGLQYHPESICTNKEGKTVIENWFRLAKQWNQKSDRTVMRDFTGSRGGFPLARSLLSRVDQQRLGRFSSNGRQRSTPERDLDWRGFALHCQYESRTIELPAHISIPDIVEKLQGSQKEHILLESSNSNVQGVGAAAVRGRFSILGMNIDSTLRIEYSTGDSAAKVVRPSLNGQGGCDKDDVSLKLYGGIWPFLANFLEKRRVSIGSIELPFWGGFMGYTTYELGLAGIDVKSINRQHSQLDLCFAWVTQSIVIDHEDQKIHVQHLHEKGLDTWLGDTVSQLLSMFEIRKGAPNRRHSKADLNIFEDATVKPRARLPSNSVYEAKVRDCQERIRRGDSYELCLTDQTEVVILRPRASSGSHGTISNTKGDTTACLQTAAWSLYKSLRRRQPAPFSSFIRLGPATFVSGSPEHFLKWNSTGKCELRPMKGTVRKSSTVSTLAQAEFLLKVPKEQAENLMIVDLVRHDLHGVCGAGNVTVPRLMVVEEYASVFQMISVVEGHIPQLTKEGLTNVEQDRHVRIRHTGMDVLAAALPPGSMTGAPKKRSCEILQEIESGKQRSLYSGVVGYMDVGGRGDFSVNIRCMFKWDNEVVQVREGQMNEDSQHAEIWHIGAGGAVTALSTPLAEREEMQTKLGGTLGIFGLKVET